MRYADMPSIAGVQSIDDLGKGIAYGNSSFSSPTTPPFVVDWEIVDKQLEGLWDDGTESTTPDEPTDPTPTPTDPTPSFETTWKPTQNYDGGGYQPGQFGRGPKYAEYEDMFRNSINEGFTLEEAMRNSRTTTPEDFLNAFGSRDEWKKWGGGSKSGSGASRSSSGGINSGGINSSGPNRGARSTGGTSRNSHNRGGR